mmetsp:Transcript_47899/g.137948  ORF Transcript_47899/g.137948 Transcript_47899/m.137948 type:complete len:87 (+) Transcript_47899:604-864(+)
MEMDCLMRHHQKAKDCLKSRHRKGMACFVISRNLLRRIQKGCWMRRSLMHRIPSPGLTTRWPYQHPHRRKDYSMMLHQKRWVLVRC